MSWVKATSTSRMTAKEMEQNIGADFDTRAYLAALREEQAQQRQQRLDEMPWYQAGAIGAGNAFMDVVRGARDLVGLENPGQAEANQYYQQLQQAQPVATTAGEIAPYIAASFVAPSVGARGIAGQVGTSGLLGGIRQQGDLGERLVSAGQEGGLAFLGGKMGDMTGRVLNRARQAVGSRPIGRAQDIASDAVERFRQLGGKVTPGQASGSPLLQRLEAPLQSAGLFDAMTDANQKLMRTSLSRAIGSQSDDLSAAGLGKAADDIAQRFTEAIGDVKISMDDDLIKRIAQIKRLDKWVELPETMANLSGNTFKQIRSTLSKAMSSAYRSQNDTQGDFIARTIKQMDNKFMKAAGPKRAADFRTAREQWKNLVTLEKGRAITPDGVVNPASVHNAYVREFGPTARRAQTGIASAATDDAMEMARLQASRQLAPVVGTSGTAERLGVGLGPMAIGGALGYGATGDVQGAIAGGLLGAGLRYGYQPMSALMSPTASQLGTQLGAVGGAGLMREFMGE